MKMTEGGLSTNFRLYDSPPSVRLGLVCTLKYQTH